MIWINLLLKKHCRQLKNSKNKAVFLNLHRALMKMFKGIVNIVEDNIYTIKYLTEFEGDKKIFKILIKSMTNYKSSERPDLENILKDKENYPIFFEKYQLALEGKYKSLIELDKLENYRRDSYDFTASIGNFKKRFTKRSDSMKFVDKKF